jgi:hypothetical protein
VPVLPWYWNPELRIACPPGIGSFIAGAVYAHGGVSLQESVIPELTVERGAEVARATITDVQWRGMRLRVRASASVPSLRVDLRTNAKQPASSLAASAKDLDANGEASLVVTDDKHEGAAAVIVVLDRGNNILDRRPRSIERQLRFTTATWFAKTSSADTPASTRSRRMSSSSCSAGTVPARTRRRSPRDWRSLRSS